MVEWMARRIMRDIIWDIMFTIFLCGREIGLGWGLVGYRG